MTEETSKDVKVANLWRQEGFFSSCDFQDEIHVVGVGATGSHIVDTLASMGIWNITVYDYDKVEDHNLPNQVFKLQDVGKFKVDALKQHVKEKMGFDIKAVNKKVQAIETLSGYLVLCADSMQSQKEIMLSSARMNRKVKYVLETRMGIDQGRIYLFNPSNKIHLKRWSDEWYSDDNAVESPCNVKAIACTAKLIASLAASKIVMLNKRDDVGYIDNVTFNRTLVGINGLIDNTIW